MEEENQNDGTWSGLKKTLIATLTTVITAGGVWLSTTLFNGGIDSSEEVKTEQIAPVPAAAPVIINLQNNNTQQSSTGNNTTIIKERIVEKKVENKKEKKSETEDAPW